jgi:hypothetical protein
VGRDSNNIQKSLLAFQPPNFGLRHKWTESVQHGKRGVDLKPPPERAQRHSQPPRVVRCTRLDSEGWLLCHRKICGEEYLHANCASPVPHASPRQYLRRAPVSRTKRPALLSRESNFRPGRECINAYNRRDDQNTTVPIREAIPKR